MASIRDVAKLAQVAPSTVSLVLNNKGYVSDASRKKVLDEIKASGKTPSGLRRRVDSSYALKHKELLKKYAQSSIVGNSKELLANQLEYETDIYVIKRACKYKKDILKDMLKDFLPNRKQ